MTVSYSSVFIALGELGPGNNCGLCAAKTSATAIRGQYYGIAAACGKIGAFVGTYVFPVIQNNAPNEVRSGQDPFFVSSSLCIFSAALAFFLLPNIGQVCRECAFWFELPVGLIIIRLRIPLSRKIEGFEKCSKPMDMILRILGIRSSSSSSRK